MKQIRKYTRPTKNPNVGGKNFWSGWCGAAVREGFGIPQTPGYPSATASRQKAKRLHTDRKYTLFCF